ncbi:16S ribosomal RNA methyltransferase A [Saccharolobus solfataricus]|uniref:16S ribosomal RNA methyltransferase A n=1 Tax=Saccharolobus solfataricus TaxID=2287 RepID=UPI001E2F650E|nr:16S ribosomal RNA methyltransferase A [Saccharolobus solfataricus]
MSYVDNGIRPILEIGCGKGNITRFLEPDICIELDDKMIEYLKNFNLVIADARYLPVLRGQLVSSLPYQITSDFFKEVIKLNNIRKLTLILQKDFVDKIFNDSTYISFLLNYIYNIQIKDIIPPSCFSPRPKVYSIITIFNRIREYDKEVDSILSCISRYRNKTLRKASKLCGFSSNNDLKVREFKPWQVLELLNSVG